MIGKLLILVARGWQLTFSAVLPPSCRFTPSCSAYAIEAIEARGALVGSALALRRILRCHPWGGSGYDPVPRAGEDKVHLSACSGRHEDVSR